MMTDSDVKRGMSWCELQGPISNGMKATSGAYLNVPTVCAPIPFGDRADALKKYLLTQTPSLAGQSTPDVPDADDGSSGTTSSTPGTSATQMREPEPAATAGEGPSRTSSPDCESETETIVTWDTQPEADLAEGRTSIDVEVFTPETCASECEKYRFHCSTGGVYQCLYTGLIFKADTAAEVHYQTVPWDHMRLASDGLEAAGPLFQMKRLHGAISQLGFPHCEILSSDQSTTLTIVHITAGKFETLKPLTVSDTHVFLNITGFCRYGLAQKQQNEENCRHIRALVLLFLSGRMLKVLLLPQNVVLNEVRKKRTELIKPKTEFYVDTTSNCKLIPDGKYKLECIPETPTITPDITEFHDKNYDNYIAAFQLDFGDMDPTPVRLQLKADGKECVWNSYVNLPDYLSGSSSTDSRELLDPINSALQSPYTPPAQAFFHKHKEVLQTRLGLLKPIINGLEKRKVLNIYEKEILLNEKTQSDQCHSLLGMLNRKGRRAQKEFYEVLKEWDPLLIEDLENPNGRD